jgi:hypothetical protein
MIKFTVGDLPESCGSPQYLVYRIVYCVSRIAQFYILYSQLPLLLYQTGRECSMNIELFWKKFATDGKFVKREV